MHSNLLLNSIDKNKSITVLTNYRTGSTALCIFLENTNPGINFLKEFWHQDNLEKISRYPNEVKNMLAKRCLIKIHMNHLNYVKDYNLEDTFKIKLYRKNIEEQVVSYYVARMSNKWHDITEQRTIDISLDIEQKLFYESYCEIKKGIELLDTVKGDLTLYYEDLPLILNQVKKKNSKPKNYDELAEHLHKLLMHRNEQAFWLSNE